MRYVLKEVEQYFDKDYRKVFLDEDNYQEVKKYSLDQLEKLLKALFIKDEREFCYYRWLENCKRMFKDEYNQKIAIITRLKQAKII